jgi:hypothetical protein
MYMILYIEQQILDHPRTQQICAFFPRAQKIVINHYKNIFDRKFPKIHTTSLSQGGITKNILVLAELKGSAITKAPDGYGHAGE